VTTKFGRLFALLGAMVLTFALVGTAAAYHGGTHTSESVSQTVAPGGTATTDTEGDGATAEDPVETAVTHPTGGTVTIDETPISGTAPSGFTFFGQQVNITAPSTTADNPIVIVFALDGSLLTDVDRNTVEVFRNGVLVADCTGAANTAAPDPCLSSRTTVGDDLQLRVLTSQASAWNFGRPAGGAAPLPNTAMADAASGLLIVTLLGGLVIVSMTAVVAVRAVRAERID